MSVHKIEEVEVREMVEYLKEARPYLGSTLEQLTNREVKDYYQMVIREKKKKSLMDKDIKHKNIIERENLYQKKNENLETVKLNQEELNLEVVRQKLIKNLPTIAQHITNLNQKELQQLYSQLKSHHESQNNQNSDMTDKIEQIKMAYPHLAFKLNNFNKQDVEKLYNTIPLKKYQRKSAKSQESELDVKSMKMRQELKRKIPQQSQNIDNFTSEELQELYSQVTEDEGNLIESTWLKSFQEKPKNSSKSSSRRTQVQKDILRQNPFKSKQLSQHSLNADSQNRDFKLWSKQHKQGRRVNARSYLMMYTQYGPKKESKRSQNIGGCQCPCCKNNTFVNMFKQMTSFMQEHKY